MPPALAPLQAARLQLVTRQRTATELTQQYLGRLESVEGRVQSFITVGGQQALAAAAAIDSRLARGEEVGPLAGVVMGIKVRVGRTHRARRPPCDGRTHLTCGRGTLACAGPHAG